ncbi:MAG: aminodeoxychorismate/anthranilate synthase component II [Cytophagales bacterium]|jgi:anthranilate synthase component 2|nr:aminodeoxychorismate/anthranilate synthase component II [Cytophagales bacterium]MCA6367395.1 aminodeoxychorismate/anthranilate synthase component II [Cytophagales bacterium]MCA6371380.1 aminodeoxychorismate/anthranilate synthase component II [Cytophagales bacterium]MCA6377531.1 aminodeoxychorismate/anthranilate synthase component II [Cytophagales bacterium]MCA6383940.1 aminodeoxychorismate/anthranilate synthase component II [Cytophagales bacterium]
MKILVLDNYDSFTYNLVHIIRELAYPMDIFRNDKISVGEVKKYDKILLSPGPGIPDEAGIMKEVIKTYAPSKSILGVCLGHQGIAEVFGGELFNIPTVLHGVTSTIELVDPSDKLFHGIPTSFQACHYHSWAVKANHIPNELRVTATNKDGLVMAIAHKQFDVRGVQFHPESIMTEHGQLMIKNWLTL